MLLSTLQLYIFLNDAYLLSLLILVADDMSDAVDDRHSCVCHFISLNTNFV